MISISAVIPNTKFRRQKYVHYDDIELRRILFPLGPNV